MAFRTNKVPAIEERTVSGSSVSFNSAFALPLKACKVSFMATQSGSGTPSPSNPRAISGVSAIGLTANSTPVSVSLGDTRYGGELDVLTGELTITHVMENITRFTYIGASSARTPVSFSVTQFHTRASSIKGMMCNIMKVSNTSGDSSADDDILTCRYGTGSNPTKSCWVFFPLSYNITSLSDANTWLSNNPTDLVYELEEPITIQLSANELSSIIGNNTFSTDTGTLEITFSDLQEKSASGAVATFNTALAMPLPSCNIAVNAWQEGSGDPSPSNVRPIHGFSEVNATRAGNNLFDNSVIGVDGKYLNIDGDEITNNRYEISPYIEVIANTPYFWAINGVPPQTGVQHNAPACCFYDEDYNYISGVNAFGSSGKTFTTPRNARYLRLPVYKSYKSTEMLSVGTTRPTSYEPYVTPTIYTIQLGQEVYGAEVDVVNGVADVKYSIADLGDYSWTKRPNTTGLFFTRMAEIGGANGEKIVLCSDYKVEYIASINSTANLTINDTRQLYANCVAVRNDDYDNYTEAEFKAAMTGVKVVYQLLTPFTIQLTPTQIATIIGNNTIFADTGDIDLTYKDLDIAKRGNFREVFKLPS